MIDATERRLYLQKKQNSIDCDFFAVCLRFECVCLLYVFQGIKKARTALKKGLFLRCDRSCIRKNKTKRIRWRIHIISKLCNDYARQNMMIKEKSPHWELFVTEYYRKTGSGGFSWSICGIFICYILCQLALFFCKKIQQQSSFLRIAAWSYIRIDKNRTTFIII